MIHWNPDPVLFAVGPLQIRWYSLMFLIGFTIGFQIIKRMCLRDGKPVEKLDTLLVWVVLATIIGARLGHCLFYDPDYYLSHPLDILKVWEGGLASHGGTLGVILALVMFSRRNPEFGTMWLLDHVCVPVPLVASLIRVGNVMNSEILGKPWNGPWSFVFTRVDQVPRHPGQLYESLAYMILFAINYTLYRKNPDRPAGFFFGLTIFWIFAARILLETFKENQEPFENGMLLNMGQILSIPLALAGLAIFVRALRAKPAKA